MIEKTATVCEIQTHDLAFECRYHKSTIKVGTIKVISIRVLRLIFRSKFLLVKFCEEFKFIFQVNYKIEFRSFYYVR